MSDYTDLFIRDSLGESNTLPRKDGQTQSPDIISSGGAPADDPGTEFGADSYDDSPGEPVVYGQPNYIYVRGKNFGTSLAVGTVTLYAAYKTQLSNPQAWTQLTTSAGSITASAAAVKEDVAVTTEPFVWTPSAPATGNPYYLIAVIATQKNPDPVPAYKKKPEDFSKWQSGQGGVTALTISVPTPPAAKSAYAFSTVVNLGNAAPAQLSFNLAWTGAVKGDLISLSIDSGGTAPIGFHDMPVSSPSLNSGTTASVAANFSAVIQCIYKAQDEKNLPAPVLTLTVSTLKTTSGSGPLDPEQTTATAVAIYTFTPNLSPS